MHDHRNGRRGHLNLVGAELIPPGQGESSPLLDGQALWDLVTFMRGLAARPDVSDGMRDGFAESAELYALRAEMLAPCANPRPLPLPMNGGGCIPRRDTDDEAGAMRLIADMIRSTMEPLAEARTRSFFLHWADRIDQHAKLRYRGRASQVTA